MARISHTLCIILRIESKDAVRVCVDDAFLWRRPISAVNFLCSMCISSTSSCKLAISSPFVNSICEQCTDRIWNMHATSEYFRALWCGWRSWFLSENWALSSGDHNCSLPFWYLCNGWRDWTFLESWPCLSFFTWSGCYSCYSWFQPLLSWTLLSWSLSVWVEACEVGAM